MAIKAVVFDVGGVLCEWTTIVRKFAKEAQWSYDRFYSLFIKLSFDPQQGSDLGKISSDEFFRRLAAAIGKPELGSQWRREFVPGFSRIEPSFKLVDELKGKYRLAVLTNAKTGLWDEWQEGKLREYFEVIVDSAEVHVLKPDEKIYRILLERLKLPAEECLFIDDFAEYVEAAKQLGFQTVHFTDPEESVKEIRRILELE